MAGGIESQKSREPSGLLGHLTIMQTAYQLLIRGESCGRVRLVRARPRAALSPARIARPL